MTAHTAIPVSDRDFLWWLAERLVHDYRQKRNNGALSRLAGIVQNTPIDRKTVFINGMAATGSLNSRHDRDFLHALANVCIAHFHEPPYMAFIVRLRGIANATPLSQISA